MYITTCIHATVDGMSHLYFDNGDQRKPHDP